MTTCFDLTPCFDNVIVFFPHFLMFHFFLYSVLSKVDFFGSLFRRNNVNNVELAYLWLTYKISTSMIIYFKICIDAMKFNFKRLQKSFHHWNFVITKENGTWHPITYAAINIRKSCFLFWFLFIYHFFTLF